MRLKKVLSIVLEVKLIETLTKYTDREKRILLGNFDNNCGIGSTSMLYISLPILKEKNN